MSQDIAKSSDVAIAMRDGITLSADIYWADSSKEATDAVYPVILVRTSYNKENVYEKTLDPFFFTKWGYVVVVQDVRGRYKSDGLFYPGSLEVEDGYDTVEWLVNQPWCNGRVGMTGISYVASVQTAAALSGTPHLASIVFVKGCSDYYRYCFRQGGAFMLYRVPLSFSLALKSREAAKDPALKKRLAKEFRAAPDWVDRASFDKGDSPLSALPDYERYLLDQMYRQDYDDFWKRAPMWQPLERMERHADVAGFYICGWYDKYRADIMFTERTKTAGGRPKKLLIGPYTHLDFGRFAGDVDFGPDAEINYNEYMKLQLDWFEATMKDSWTSHNEKEYPVKIFVMGGGTGKKTPSGKLDHAGAWRLEREWPLNRTRHIPFYFQKGGSLSEQIPQEINAKTEYIYDPNDPVPTIGGTSYFVRGGEQRGETTLFVPYGAHNQIETPDTFSGKQRKPLEDRQDVLVFRSAPLQKDIEVTGSPIVIIWASSTAIDTDFTAKLIDFYPPGHDYPDGYAMNLSDSIMRACYRNGFGRKRMMKPGNIYKFTIELPPTSNLFKTGHCIRLDISSSNYPAYDKNTNTGETFKPKLTCIVARNTIYHQYSAPSQIILPIVPN